MHVKKENFYRLYNFDENLNPGVCWPVRVCFLFLGKKLCLTLKI